MMMRKRRKRRRTTTKGKMMGNDVSRLPQNEGNDINEWKRVGRMAPKAMVSYP
jgi:hypothetical protein